MFHFISEFKTLMYAAIISNAWVQSSASKCHSMLTHLSSFYSIKAVWEGLKCQFLSGSKAISKNYCEYYLWHFDGASVLVTGRRRNHIPEHRI